MEQLDNIIKEYNLPQDIVNDINALKLATNNLRRYTTKSSDISMFNSKLKQFNFNVNASNIDFTTKIKVRACVGIMARNLAIEQHNKYLQTAFARDIMVVLMSEFKDIYELRYQLYQDMLFYDSKTVQQQIH